MYLCYLHNWSNNFYMCPSCYHEKYITTDGTGLKPGSVIGLPEVNVVELQKQNAELKSLLRESYQYLSLAHEYAMKLNSSNLLSRIKEVVSDET